MAAKPELILDIAGVLATNFSPVFWQQLSSNHNVPYETLTKFKQTINQPLKSLKICLTGMLISKIKADQKL